MPGETLPLFPLNVVLLPRSSLPLHIFEDRYKTLIGECRARQSDFGMTLVTGKRMAHTGCSAAVVEVTREYPDGRLDIVAQGRRRFRLLSYDPARAPYLTGVVEYVDDAIEDQDRDLAAQTIELFNRLVEVAFKGKVGPIPPSDAGLTLSYVMAQKAGLDVSQRQHLLEQVSENERLRFLRKHFDELIPRLEKAEEIERVLRGDGYLPWNSQHEEKG